MAIIELLSLANFHSNESPRPKPLWGGGKAVLEHCALLVVAFKYYLERYKENLYVCMSRVPKLGVSIRKVHKSKNFFWQCTCITSVKENLVNKLIYDLLIFSELYFWEWVDKVVLCNFAPPSEILPSINIFLDVYWR